MNGRIVTNGILGQLKTFVNGKKLSLYNIYLIFLTHYCPILEIVHPIILDRYQSKFMCCY